MPSHETLPKERVAKHNPVPEPITQADTDEATLWDDFIKLLESIDTEASLAKLNETTIAGENGQRIEL